MTSFLKSKAFKLLIIILLVFTAYKFFVNYQDIKRLERKVDKLEESIDIAKETNQKLQDELENINSPEYIEKIARNELGLVKPGELLLIPVEEENKDKESKEQSNKQDK